EIATNGRDAGPTGEWHRRAAGRRAGYSCGALLHDTQLLRVDVVEAGIEVRIVGEDIRRLIVDAPRVIVRRVELHRSALERIVIRLDAAYRLDALTMNPERARAQRPSAGRIPS